MSNTPVRIEDLLRAMVAAGASDLHIKANSPPGFRVDGEIVLQHAFGILSPDDTLRLATEVMSEEQGKVFAAEGDLDCSIAVPGLSRFRVNVLQQRGTVGVVLRQIPEQIASAAELGLPKVCIDLACKPRGLVLVTGPTGSGKSTTLAALVDYINDNERGHIVTMEDPLEFVHQDKGCLVTQRQIGTDCRNFQKALRHALRQDPDVILIGEMRDLDTIELAITAAETGHLVFGTLHTTTAVSTVDRIIDVFPSDAQQQVRTQLASTLQGVISQCLVPAIGGGRAAAFEILIAVDGVRSLIREGRTAQIQNLMQTGMKYGMQTLEQGLVELVNSGRISLVDAIGHANRPDEVQQNAKAGIDPHGGVMGSGVRRPSANPASLRQALAPRERQEPPPQPLDDYSTPRRPQPKRRSTD